MDLEFGNCGALNTEGSGWFIGFSDWARSGGPNLRHMPIDLAATGLCVKWFMHPPGHPNGEDKLLSEERTVSILVGAEGAFQRDFSASRLISARETRSCNLKKAGDFAL